MSTIGKMKYIVLKILIMFFFSNLKIYPDEKVNNCNNSLYSARKS